MRCPPGKLTLRAENVHLIADSAGLPKDVPPGPFVRIRVEDTGTGIPDAVREHIFGLFFHDQEPGPGNRPRSDHGPGHREKPSGFHRLHHGRGTGYHLRGSFAGAPPRRILPPAGAAGAAAAPRAGGELVLLVDDEPACPQRGSAGRFERTATKSCRPRTASMPWPNSPPGDMKSRPW